MIGYERFIADFRVLGYEVEGPLDSGQYKWAIINAFPIVGGRFACNTVRVAIPVPGDYPTTPPGGLYVSPCIVPGEQMQRLNVHDRQNETAQLPGQWQYWSRPIPQGTWPGPHAAKRLVAHWNAVFTNVAA